MQWNVFLKVATSKKTESNADVFLGTFHKFSVFLWNPYEKTLLNIVIFLQYRRVFLLFFLSTFTYVRSFVSAINFEQGFDC